MGTSWGWVVLTYVTYTGMTKAANRSSYPGQRLSCRPYLTRFAGAPHVRPNAPAKPSTVAREIATHSWSLMPGVWRAGVRPVRNAPAVPALPPAKNGRG